MKKRFMVMKKKALDEFPSILLEGNAKARRIVTTKRTGARRAMLGICTIQPGAEHGWHTHPPGEEEMNYIIGGSGLILWKEGRRERSQKVGKGDVIFTPEKVPNMQRCLGRKPFVFLYAVSPPRE